ncbi:MAG: KH domain-containing protein [Bacilli bacterium]
MQSLIQTITTPLVDFPEAVQVSVEEIKGEQHFSLSVHPTDVGKVIGKQGRIAKAIRTIVYAANHGSKSKVYLEIGSVGE